jgi:predicted DNA-binding protein
MADTQILIRIDQEMKKKLARFALLEGKNSSQVVRELVEQYIQNHDISVYIDDLWGRVNKKFKAKGISTKEIKQAILAVRAEQK